MRQKRLRIVAAGSLVVLTFLGCLMRTAQLNTIFDAAGLPLANHPLSWMLGILTALWILVSILFAATLPKSPCAVTPCRMQFLALLIAGILVLVSALIGIYQQIRIQPVHYTTALYFLQLLSALCIFTAAWRQWQGTRPGAGFYAVVCIWQLLVLLLNFRGWSMDPVILDYCFRQFALVSGMCAAYHVGALSVGQKGRRMAAFWCMAGSYFAALSIFGESLGWCLMELGMSLWLLVHVWQLFASEE